MTLEGKRMRQEILKLDTVLEVHPHQCWAEGKDHVPQPAGNTLPAAAQDITNFVLYKKCPYITYLNHGNKRHNLLHILLQLWQVAKLTGNYFIIWQLTSTVLDINEYTFKRTGIIKKINSCPLISYTLHVFPKYQQTLLSLISTQSFSHPFKKCYK